MGMLQGVAVSQYGRWRRSQSLELHCGEEDLFLPATAAVLITHHTHNLRALTTHDLNSRHLSHERFVQAGIKNPVTPVSLYYKITPSNHCKRLSNSCNTPSQAPII